MSTTEKPPETALESATNGIGRPPKEFTLEHLTDPAEFVRILNRTQHLTDEAYSDIINDIGWRAAILVLRTKALTGDTRALDLYLRVCRDSKRSRESAVEERTVNSEFAPAARAPDADDQ